MRIKPLQLTSSHLAATGLRYNADNLSRSAAGSRSPLAAERPVR